jgi:hypothetical protein
MPFVHDMYAQKYETKGENLMTIFHFMMIHRGFMVRNRHDHVRNYIKYNSILFFLQSKHNSLIMKRTMFKYALIILSEIQLKRVYFMKKMTTFISSTT